MFTGIMNRVRLELIGRIPIKIYFGKKWTGFFFFVYSTIPLWEIFLEFIAIDLFDILTVNKVFRAISWGFYVNLHRDDDDFRLSAKELFNNRPIFIFQNRMTENNAQ